MNRSAHRDGPRRRRAAAAVGLGGVMSLVAAFAAADDPVSESHLPPIAWREAATVPAAPRLVRRAADVIDSLPAAVDSESIGHVLIGFDGPPSRADRTLLAASGVVLQAPVGRHSWFARIDGPRFDAPRLAGLSRPVVIESIPRAAKLHPLVRRGAFPAWARVESGGAGSRVVAQVLFHRDVARADALAAIAEVGGESKTILQTANAMVVELPADSIDALADRTEVQWIEPPLPRFSGSNAENRSLIQAEIVQAAPDPNDQGPGYHLDGSGVVIMLYDTGVPFAGHVDFGGRVTPRDSDNTAGHSTHVAGTIAGSGAASNGAFRGMAPGATIEAYGLQFGGDEIFLYQNPGDVENDYADAMLQHGAVLANNSLGTSTSLSGFPCEINGDYGIMAHVIDSIVRGGLGAPMRIVWSNGNERGVPECGEAYYTVSPPSGAKNLLAVGAVNAGDASMTDFTSWGPMDDGRLRPDVSAPGCQTFGDFGVTSTFGIDQYAILCGTSMAAPTVTGAAALLLEDYRDRFPGRADFLPATMKALFIHAALDLESPGPDYRSGYGLVQIKDTIDVMRAGGFLETTLDQGDSITARLTVAAGASRVKATIAWDDPPATPNVVGSLVNDLDLRIDGPGGSWFPWTLDPADPAAPAVRTGPDRLNNVEQVVIDAPAAGVYTVTITGAAVAEGPQRVSLVATPALAAVAIDWPDGRPAAVAPAQAQVVTARVRALGQAIVPGSVRLHHRVGAAPFNVVEMTSVGSDVYHAILPAQVCGAALELHVSAEGTLTGVETLPPGAPATSLQLPVATERVRFEDDFQADTGWTVTVSDTLITGAWERGVPVGDGLRGDPVHDADGSGACYLTMNQVGNTDVDLGSTTLTSPALDASADAPVLRYWRWFSTIWGSEPIQDVLTVEISDDDGATWRDLEIVGPGGPDAVGGWRSRSFDLSTIPDFALNDTCRVRFTADDAIPGSIVEAAIDGVRLTSLECDDVPAACEGDFDGSGTVDIDDLVAVVLGWGPCLLGPQACADLDGSGFVDAADIMVVIERWGPCP